MARPRIRHIALNVKDPVAEARYYVTNFGLEQKFIGPNGTIYLSDGFVGVALISVADLPYGINHFGFQVDSIEAVEEAAQATAKANVSGAVAEKGLVDPEGNRIDVAEDGWPI